MRIQKYQIDQLVSLPLEAKVIHSQNIVRNFYENEKIKGNIYVSFSGGKDSTVLLDIVRDISLETKAVFYNTGIEFPEILEFIKTIENVEMVKPKMSFKEILEKYGYPVIGKETSAKIYEIRTTKSQKLKNKRLYGDEKGNGKMSEKWKYLIDCPFKISDLCCDVLKKRPAIKFEKETGLHPVLGMMIKDSSLRKTSIMKAGCNSFESKRPSSNPLFFWNEEDIWDYIRLKNIKYSSIYDKGYDRTGCVYCMFGIMSDPDKFIKLKKTHPQMYNYCMNKLNYSEILNYLNIKY